MVLNILEKRVIWCAFGLRNGLCQPLLRKLHCGLNNLNYELTF